MDPRIQESDLPPEPSPFGTPQFATTHWSVVLGAIDETSTRSQQALEVLCRTYWYPLYAYVRRLGHSFHDSQDLVQGFFALLLEKGSIRKVAPANGRFRSFLLASMNHFLSNQRDRQRALKRGGGQAVVFFDALDAEDRYSHELSARETPDKLYDKQWALGVLDSCLNQLGREFSSDGRDRRFERLKGFLSESPADGDYQSVANDLGMTPHAVSVAVGRLRKRYSELVLGEISRTVSTPVEARDELRHLLKILCDR